jgi:hypothetical protein
LTTSIKDPFHRDTATNVAELDAFSSDFISDIVQCPKDLWEDEIIQTPFEHRNATAIPDHMEYFFE